MKTSFLRYSLIFFIHSFSYSIAFANPIYVDQNAVGLNDGSSWANAYTQLQIALDSSLAGNSIWVAQGTYFPSEDITGDTMPTDNSTKTFYINKNIQIYGGFNGTETTLNQRNTSLNITILSGDLGILNDSLDNAYHVVFIDGATNMGNIDQTMIIDGFTIQKGNARQTSSNSIHNSGGAIFNNAASSWSNPNRVCSPTISNNIFQQNVAFSNGAAIYGETSSMGTSSPMIKHNTFIQNNAFRGGAIFNNAKNYGISKPTIQYNTFVENVALYGGAIYNYDESPNSIPYISHNTFIRNSASSGGAIYVYSFGFAGPGAYPIIINNIFEANDAYYSDGGAIYIRTPKALVLQNIFKQNTAGRDGGAALFLSSDVYIWNNLWHHNVAASRGGAIYTTTTTQTITDNTFGNNSSGSSGGAIYFDNIYNNNVSIKNSIFWANGDEIYNNSSASVSLEYCILDDANINGMVNYPTTVTGNNNLDSYPLFLDSLNGDFRLQNGSPAIDAGNNTSWNNTNLSVDIAGNPKPQNGIVDIGAYEGGIVLNIEKHTNISSNITAYPNPTQLQLTIDLEQQQQQVNIQVSNLMGQVVQEASYQQQQQINLRLEGTPGVYFVHIQTNTGEQATFKVLKE